MQLATYKKDELVLTKMCEPGLVPLLCMGVKKLAPFCDVVFIYSKTCLERSLKKNTKQNWFSIQIIAYYRPRVLQNTPMGAFCNTFDLH